MRDLSVAGILLPPNELPCARPRSRAPQGAGRGGATVIYASAVTCDRHEGCWNALVESGSPPYHLFRPVHGSLQSARDVAERLAARCAAQEPDRPAWVADWRPGWLGIEYYPCAVRPPPTQARPQPRQHRELNPEQHHQPHLEGEVPPGAGAARWGAVMTTASP